MVLMEIDYYQENENMMKINFLKIENKNKIKKRTKGISKHSYFFPS